MSVTLAFASSWPRKMNHLLAIVVHGFISGLLIIPVFSLSFRVVPRLGWFGKSGFGELTTVVFAGAMACLVSGMILLGPAYLFDLWANTKAERQTFVVALMIGAALIRVPHMIRARRK